VILVAVAFVSSWSTQAYAESAPKRVVVYIEATGMDLTTARGRLHDSIPEKVVALDPSDFRSNLTEKGQKTTLAQSFSSPKERATLFWRIRQALSDLHADLAVIALIHDTTTVRIARVTVLTQSEETPRLDQVIMLDPARMKTDATKIKDVLGPTLQDLTAPEEEPPAPTPSASPAEPVPATSSTGGQAPSILAEPRAAAKPRSKAPLYGLGGGAVAGAAVGTIFGLRALSAASSYKSTPSTVTAADGQGYATISTVGFVVAGVLTAATLYFLFGPSSDSDSP
jgi:hypothetical protein